MQKRILLIAASLMITLVSCGQKEKKNKTELEIKVDPIVLTNKAIKKPGHKIEFSIDGMVNEKMLIAYHYSGKHYISDTVYLNDKGIGILEGKEAKEKGVYLAVFPSLNNKYFEFLVSDQHFKISTNKEELGLNMKYVHSPENELFTKDMQEMNALRAKSEAFKKQLKTTKGKEKEEIETKIETLNKKYIANRKAIAEQFPDFFYTDLLGLMREIEIPEPPKDENGALIDSSFGWKYWKKHYWDFTDFSEEGILRTPIFHNKLLQFITKRTAPVQDSIIKSCHIVLDRAKANEEVFKYSLVTLLNKYASSKIMGDDAVYVDLVNSYYKTGDASWTDSAQLAKMVERAGALEPLLIGKISPDLTLRGPDLKVKYRLHDLPFDYTIVFVWDHECGHCKKAVPIIHDFYEKYKDKGVMVYAISTVNYGEVEEWRKFIKEKDLKWVNVADPYNETPFRKVYDISSTPQIFFLDKNKKIIAKRIGAKQLEEFFYNYLKRFDKEKFKGMKEIDFSTPKDSTKTK